MPPEPTDGARTPERVCAVVVTYNRRDLLRECLAAIRAQSRPVDQVLVVDNASTDGTSDMLAEEYPDVSVLALSSNEGGAGGFHEGMRLAHERGFDWIWLMDDDTIPSETALDLLLGAQDRLDGLPRPYLLASRATWKDGRLHPMNSPGHDRRRIDHLLAAIDRGLMPLRTTTFVSLLVSADTIRDHGLPHKHYFLWSDDIEYTAKVLRDGYGYLVPESVVLHKTKEAYTAVTTTDHRFYYHVRNTLFMLRGRSWDRREKLGLVWILLKSSAQWLSHNRFRPAYLATIVRGLRDGVVQPAG